jgi:hypothetical protein
VGNLIPSGIHNLMPKGNLSFDAKAIQNLMPSAIRAANKFLIPKDQINNSRSDQICAAIKF